MALFGILQTYFCRNMVYYHDFIMDTLAIFDKLRIN